MALFLSGFQSPTIEMITLPLAHLLPYPALRHTDILPSAMTYERGRVMGEPQEGGELSRQERHIIALLRQGPQSIDELAEALCVGTDQAQDILQSLDRKVGIVPLFRYDILRYGLGE